ncbi:Rv3235 family protein [Cellulomonas shaoxiangyii]|uniref:Energy transducer TonB n=1 Tax=Cellulomonas shaoxiangyii TaxID=2566013 RepID=A0A4P7SHL5_9CELL|nr:Rv3235 family protein [Cellulomonas shaoxiangyii]QCB93171.1 energy transducer TonB [Cellulomonas shaoxiangyii]TGY77807.1 energy transducer TonB [Cellulomonas shaoxiangyii]
MTTLLQDATGPTGVEAALHRLHPVTATLTPVPTTPAADPHVRARTVDPLPTPARTPRLRLVPAAAPAPRLRAERPLGPPPTVADRVRLVASDRALVAEAADEEPGPEPDVDAGRFAHGVGLACVEVVQGRRPAGQLARWLAPGVLHAVQERAALSRRAGVPTPPRRPQARRVRVCAIDARTAEACLVVDDGTRVRAVALRLEAHRGGWRVTILEIG